MRNHLPQDDIRLAQGQVMTADRCIRWLCYIVAFAVLVWLCMELTT